MKERITAQEYRQRMNLPPPGQGGIVTSKAKPQIRLPSPVKMTKTEGACLMLLRSIYPGYEIRFEPWTFILPSGTRYTVDFVVFDGNRVVECTESKGAHIRSSASIRAFKEARSAFPMFNFVFRQKTKEGWTSTD